MKIAILSPFYPYRGGLAQLNARLYNELRLRNEVKAFSFTVLYPNFLFPGKTQYVAENDSATFVDSERVLNSVNPISYIKTAKAINKYSPDILIIPYWMSFMAPAFGTVCRLLNKNIKIVSLVHNAIPHERTIIDKPFARFFFKKCDGFIVMSDHVKSDLLSLCTNPKILLHSHPIYDQYGERSDRELACSKLGIDIGKKNLLFFGLIRDYKGLDALIETMDLLDDSYQLIIAGESYGSFDRYSQLINKSRNRANIKVFQEYIPDDMVSVLFSASDVLVLPYRSATQSGVVAIAYQLELPMIATDVGALGKAVSDSQTGLVVDSATSENLSRAIKEFFEDKEKIGLYIQNAKNEKNRLSWDSFSRSIEDFIKGL